MSTSAPNDGSEREKRPGALDAGESAFLRQMVRRGFLLRLAATLFLAWTGYSSALAPDETTYAVDGSGLADFWAGTAFMKPYRYFTNIPLGYFYMNAVSFYISNSDLPLRILNALVGAYCCRYAYFLGREIFSTAVGRRTATLYTIFPSLILWSALNIRDIWVIALVLFISWKSLEVARGYSHLGLLSTFAGIWALTLFRDYLFYVVALPPICGLLIGGRNRMGRNFLLSMTAALVVVYFVELGAAGRAEHHMSLEVLSTTRRNLATGGSAFEQEVDISTPDKALTFLPVGVAYFLFSPFPWQITSMLKLLSMPEMLFVYFLTPAVFRGIRFAIRERFRESAQVMILTLLLTVSYALGEGNVGTLYRHRAQAITFYLMFAAAGIELKRSLQWADAS